MLNNLLQMNLKLLKKTIRKTTEGNGNLMATKLLIKSQEPQKLHHRIIYLLTKKNYLEKDICL